MKNKDNKFDIDLSFGEAVEDELLAALEGKIEVKAERDIWQKTGNIAIEYESRGKPSGIMVTEAEHWTQALTINNQVYCYLTFSVKTLKKIVNYYVKNRPECLKRGGDNYTSKLVLIPLEEIIIPETI